MPSQIEQITNGSMGTQESLGLSDRFEPSHPSLTNPRRLMRLLCPVVGILISHVNGFRHQLPVSYSITAQFVSHDLSGFAAMTAQ